MKHRFTGVSGQESGGLPSWNGALRRGKTAASLGGEGRTDCCAACELAGERVGLDWRPTCASAPLVSLRAANLAVLRGLPGPEPASFYAPPPFIVHPALPVDGTRVSTGR
jgi:hypothetical protein